MTHGDEKRSDEWIVVLDLAIRLLRDRRGGTVIGPVHLQEIQTRIKILKKKQ
jgi:hypothetical protein